MVNATTAPSLVGYLGITAQPQARQALLKMFHSQLVQWSTCSGYPREVVHVLEEMLHEAYHHIAHKKTSVHGPKAQRFISSPLSAHLDSPSDEASSACLSPSSGSGAPTRHASNTSGGLLQKYFSRTVFCDDPTISSTTCQSNSDAINELRKLEKEYAVLLESINESRSGLMGKQLQHDNLLGKIDGIIGIIEKEWTDEGMAKVVNQIFLTLVYNNYWKLIEEGELRPGSPESEVLFTSIRVSLSPYRANLVDFEFVLDKLFHSSEFTDEDANDEDATSSALVDEDLRHLAKDGGILNKFVASWQFNVSIGLAILLNTVQVVAEEIWRDPDKKINDHIIWLLLDGFFTVFFFVEFAVKLATIRCGYFSKWWNRFDFFLVMLGIFGLAASIITHGDNSGGKSGSQTRVIRVARVLRSLRFLRIFRLFHARMSADKYVSMQLARHLKKVVTLECFVRAHTIAQVDLVKYFAGNGVIDEKKETELGRCVVQSQVATYRALTETVRTQALLGDDIYLELRNLHRRKQITENLTHFVMDAHRDGAITATETHSILHPLNHCIAECVRTLAMRSEGVLDKKPSYERDEEGRRRVSKGSVSEGSVSEGSLRVLANSSGKDLQVVIDDMKVVAESVRSLVPPDGASGDKKLKAASGEEADETPVTVKSPESQDDAPVQNGAPVLVQNDVA
jgi:hypothetical protein